MYLISSGINCTLHIVSFNFVCIRGASVFLLTFLQFSLSIFMGPLYLASSCPPYLSYWCDNVCVCYAHMHMYWLCIVTWNTPTHYITAKHTSSHVYSSCERPHPPPLTSALGDSLADQSNICTDKLNKSSENVELLFQTLVCRYFLPLSKIYRIVLKFTGL